VLEQAASTGIADRFPQLPLAKPATAPLVRRKAGRRIRDL
jgi:hypothetical protein